VSKVVEKFFWPRSEYIFRISNQWEIFFEDNYKSRRAVTERTKQKMENRICRHLNMFRGLHEGSEPRRSREGYTDALFLALSAVTKLNDVSGKSYLLLLLFLLLLSFAGLLSRKQVLSAILSTSSLSQFQWRSQLDLISSKDTRAARITLLYLHSPVNQETLTGLEFRFGG